MKYIDAEKLIKAIEEKGLGCSFALKMERLDTLALIDELQQEQPEIDLEKEVKEYIKKNFTITDEIAAIPEKDRMYSMGSDDLLYLAYYFIQLGLNARMEEKEVNAIVPNTEFEVKCLEKNCPHFIVWSYWGQELHSCKLQGESDTITHCADSEECKLNSK